MKFIQNNKYKIFNIKTLLMGLGIFLVVLALGVFIAVRNQIPFPNAKILGQKDFPAYESVSFTIKLNQKNNNTLSLVSKALATDKNQVGAAILYDKNKKSDAKVNLTKKDDDTYTVTAQNGKFFKAGHYTLAVTLSEFGNSRILTQDFSWGVLAVNTNKSIYTPGETANLSFSVLNQGGFNDCNAKLELTVTNPKGEKEVLSSANGKIKRTKDCQGENVTYNPDYFGKYATNIEGKYQMDLKSETANGVYEIKDYFKVAANQDFEVERQTATRINPVSWYKVVLKIKANKDFQGQIVENLPYAFGAKANNNGKVEFDKEKYSHIITWNEKIQKGEIKELSYEFKAPEISPEFYLLGPLQMVQKQTIPVITNEHLVFQEARFWQIAADPTNLILLWDPANGATPSGWTCISCSTGDPFFQTFIRGNSTYGGTGGSSSVTPTVSGSVTVSAEDAAGGSASNKNNASGTTHTHTASNPTIGTQSIIPAYKSLMVIRYNSGIPTGASAIPANAIAFFDATVPGGWTRYSAQDGNYVMGDWTGTAGGSNTNTFSITWNSLAAASTAQDLLVANGPVNGAASAHTHTAPSPTTSAAGNTEPPYIYTILGYASSTTSVPNAMIGMFDGAPGTGWSLKSNTGGDPFYQVFPNPQSTYGTTGGSSTHTPAGETSGNSGAPSATQTSGSGTSAAGSGHVHTESVNFNSASSIPPYTDAIFAQKTFSISGTVRQSNESTAIGNPPCDSATGVVDIRINGGTATTVSCSSVDGSYSATPGTVATGDIITIYLNASSTPKANTIIKAGGSPTDADLYQNVVIARDDSGTGIANSGVCTYTTSMLFSCSTNNITVNSNVEFHVWSGTYTAGATLTTQGTGNLHVASGATATLDTGTSTIANNVTIDSTGILNINGTGGLTVNGGNVTVTGTLNTTSGTPTITMGATGSISGAGNATFYNLSTSGTGTTTYSANGTNTINNNLTVGTGTTLNINSSMTITGTLTNTTTGIINTTSGTPTVTVNGATVGGGSGNITFYNLTTGGTTAFSGGGTNTINNNLSVSAGTLTVSSALTITGTGSVSTGATLTIGANITVNGGALTTTTTGAIGFSGTPTLTMSGTGSLGGGSGNISLYALTTSGTGTTTFSGSGTNTIANNVTVGTGTTLNINSSITITGTLTNTTTGIISTTAGTPTVTVNGSAVGGGSGSLTFYNLTVGIAGSVSFSGAGTNTINNTLAVNAGTTLSINNSVSIGNSLTNATSGAITYSGTPTITMTGSGSIGGGTTGAITIYALTTSGTGTTTFTNGGTNSIATNASVGAGTTLNLNSNITITGNITNATSGVIGTTAGTPTVTVNGSTIGGGTTGAITFYNLTVGIAGTVTFTNGGTNTVNNNVSVNAGTTLNLNSTISITGSLTNTTSGAIGTSAGTPTVTVSGSTIGGGTTGAITFYNLTKAGAGTTTFTNGGTNTINNNLSVSNGTLTQSSTLSITGTGAVSTGATFNTNANLTITGGALTTAGTGLVNTTAGTSTVTISGTGNIGGGGAVTVYNLAVNGSQTAASTITANNTISVGSSGTFTLTGQNVNSASNFTTTTTGIIACSGSSGTVTMTGGGNLGGGSGAITFCNLATTTTGTTTFTGSGTNTVNNNVSVGASTTLNLNSTISITGSLTNTTSGVIGYSAGTPTVTVSGTSLGGGTTGAITFYNLTKAGAGTTTFTSTGTNTVDNNLSVSNGTFTQSNTLTVTGTAAVSTGATFNTNANLTITGGALTTAGTGVVNTTAGTGTVTINGTGGNIGGGGTVTVYNLTLGGTGTQTLASDTTANNDISVGTGKTFSLNAKNLTVGGGDLTTTSTGSITCSGTTGTATINGTAATGIGGGAGAITFCNLTIGGTVPIASAITVNNDMTNNGATSGSVNVTVNGNIVGTGSVNMSSGTFTQRVGASKNFGTTSGASTWAFSTLTLSNSSVSPVTLTTQSGSGTITISQLNVGAGGDSSTTTLNASSRSFIISGGGTPVVFSASSGITASTSTFTYTGTGSVNLGNFSYYSLATNGSGTYLPAASPLIATNNITVTAGTLSLGTNDLTVGSSSVTNSGGISVAGTISQSATATTTILSSSAGTATIGGAGTIGFYNLSFLPTVASAPTFTLGSAASQTITIDGDLTVGNGTNGVVVTANTNNPIIDVNGSLSIAASGTFTAPPSASFTIASNMTNNGTFNNNSGTLTFDTTNTSTFAGSATPAITFNNFTSIIPNKTLSFTASKTFRIDGLFTVTGAVSNRINIQSTSGTQWLINLQGTSAVTYSTVTNSGCAGGTLNVTVDATNQNGGNNGSCWLFTLSTVNSRISGNTRVSGSLRFQ